MKKFCLFLLAAALWLGTQPAIAATLTVNTTADSPIGTAGTCSLRQAIQAANTDTPVGNCGAGDPGLDTIEFATPAGDYNLTINPGGGNDNTDGDLDICSNITINGGGIAVTNILAAFTSGNDRVLQIHNSTNNSFGCFDVPEVVAGQGGNPSPVVIINGVTIANGSAQDSFNGVFGGGGILNAGFLTINDSEVRNNTADNTNNQQDDAFGGGILHLNTTIVNRCQIHDNVVRSTTSDSGFAAYGGGVATASGDINCFDDACTLNINDTSINGNTADNGNGGGISQNANQSEVNSVIVLRSAIYGNQVTGTIGDPAGQPEFGTGGGVSRLVDTTTDDTIFWLVDSTISGNTAPKSGGGFLEASGVQSETQLLSSTIADNTAGQSGGGVKIHRNSAPEGTVLMLNTILAENTAPAGPDCNSDDPAEPLTSLGFNLIFDVAGCTLDGAQTGDVPPGNDPLLAALANNGGLTPTQALQFGSPAIDAARSEADGGCVDDSDVGGAPLLFDQRNDPFDRVVAGTVGGTPRCDIGAFEFQPITINSQKDVSTPTANIGDTFTYTLTVTNNGPGQATGVTIVDDLPDQVSFVSFGAISQGTCAENAGVVTCDIGTLAVDASASVVITVQAEVAGTVVNQATVTTNETDPQNPNVTNQVITTINGNLLLEGSGLLPCSLQRGEVPNHIPWVLFGMAALTFGSLLGWRKRRE